MAHIDSQVFHLLADLALGTYVEEEHQPARTTQAAEDSRQEAYQGFTAISSARATARLAPNLPSQLVVHLTGHNKSNILPPPYGFTAINSAAATARLASNNARPPPARPPPHGMTVSTGPPQRVTKRNSASRTTGLNPSQAAITPARVPNGNSLPVQAKRLAVAC